MQDMFMISQVTYQANRKKLIFNLLFFIIIFYFTILLSLPYINMHLPLVYTCSPS